MKITKIDVAWNLAATILRVAGGVIVMPLALHFLSSEDIGLWTIYLSIGALTYLLDFGFGDSFARNVTYIFSGVSALKTHGYMSVDENSKVDYSLLKGTIAAMRKFYAGIATLLLILLLTLGCYYIMHVMNDYQGNKLNAYIAWGGYCILIIYQLYTFYYDALLRGRGLIKLSKQILVVSNTLFIIFTSLFLLLGYGLLSLIAGQLISTIVNRVLANRLFYDKDLRRALQEADTFPPGQLLKILLPNAAKIGVTSLSGFLIARSSVIIGSLYLSLDEIGSYGITKQVLDVLASVSMVWYTSYYPMVIKFRVENNLVGIKDIFMKSITVFLGVLFIGGICFMWLGNTALGWISSKTLFLDLGSTAALIILVFIESLILISGGMLLTKNDVPFMKASVISGVFTVLLLVLMLHYTTWGVSVMILAPLIVNLGYQGWKWPWEVVKDLDFSMRDVISFFVKYIKNGLFFKLKFFKLENDK